MPTARRTLLCISRKFRICSSKSFLVNYLRFAHKVDNLHYFGSIFNYDFNGSKNAPSLGVLTLCYRISSPILDVHWENLTHFTFKSLDEPSYTTRECYDIFTVSKSHTFLDGYLSERPHRPHGAASFKILKSTTPQI